MTPVPVLLLACTILASPHLADPVELTLPQRQQQHLFAAAIFYREKTVSEEMTAVTGVLERMKKRIFDKSMAALGFGTSLWQLESSAEQTWMPSSCP